MIWTWVGQVHLKCGDMKDLLDFCYNTVVLFLQGSSYLRCYMRIAVHLLITKESSRDRYQTLASCSDKGAEQGCIFLVLVLAESSEVLPAGNPDGHSVSKMGRMLKSTAIGPKLGRRTALHAQGRAIET